MKEKVIIFIDNNENTLRLLKDYFDDLENKKFYFISTKKILSWVKENKSLYSFIIVSDYDMFDLSGLELLRRLDCNVFAKILLTNITNSNAISEAIRSGEVNEYIQKDEIDSLEKLEIILKKYL